MRSERTILTYYIEGWIIVWLIRLFLTILPFQYVISIIHAYGRKGRTGDPVSWNIVSSIVRSVKAFTNYLPRACLIRAAAVTIMLGRNGVPSRFCMGATMNSSGKICGHAWVTVAERVVIGGSESPIIYQEFRPAVGGRM